MRLIVSFASLFLSVILLQLSSGGVAPLDALSGLSLGFTTEEIGLLGSAHFSGFLIGCWWAPRLMGSVGHSRAFAAFTALGAMGVLGHMMLPHPLAWAGMRVMSGICIAGCYTVIEAWLQAKVTNETRGRAMGAYRVVDISASLAAQLIIGVLTPASYISYNILAMVCCGALLPLMLTKLKQPPTPEAPRLRPSLAWGRSPLAAAAVIVAGVTSAAFRMVGPLYGAKVGLSVDQIALFLAVFVAGGAASQYPMGWLADRFDRRQVLIALSVAGIAASALTVALSTSGTAGVLIASFAFGLTTFPIYSVATAHAHDFASQDERVELSAALMFLYAIGAIASPLFVSILIESYGPSAMFVLVSIAHLILVIFGVIRMQARTATRTTRYVWAPRTSFVIGRLLKRRRENGD